MKTETAKFVGVGISTVVVRVDTTDWGDSATTQVELITDAGFNLDAVVDGQEFDDIAKLLINTRGTIERDNLVKMLRFAADAIERLNAREAA